MYYTLEKTAEILELTPGEVNRLRESNKLRAFRDGASWKFRKEDVEKYLTDLIRERSKPAASVVEPADLLNDSDEELPTMLADSASFDAMIDATAETLEIKANAPSEPEFSLELPNEDDGLLLADEPQIEGAPTLEAQADEAPELALSEDSDLALVEEAQADEAPELALSEDSDLVLVEEPQAEEAPELALPADEDLVLADEDSNAGAPNLDDSAAAFAPEAPAADDDLILVDEAQADDDSASVFSVENDDANALGSDDDLLHLGGDSGLSLLDDVDLSGSNVSLDGDDVVLGGSGSGSGSGLSLGGDSGLSLLDENADDFAVDGSGSGLSLGGDSGLSLLDENADDFAVDSPFAAADAAEVDAAPVEEDDDSIFELAEEPKPSAVLELEQNADPDTATVLGTGEDFQLEADSTTYDVSESESASQVIAVADEEDSDPFFTKDDSDAADPFASAVETSDEVNPFASAVETPASGDAPFGDFGGFDAPASDSGFDAGFGGGFETPASDAGFGAADSFGDATPDVAPVAARVPQTEYTAKDFLFLVPCFVCILLATIGAYELCRTIWSYEEAAFDLSGPVLDMLANAVGLTK